MAAHPAVMAGKRVLMVERGDWVAREPENWGPDGFFESTTAYSREAPYAVDGDDGRRTIGTIACVGGATVFFGGVALRLREADFLPDPEISAEAGGEWPYRYADLEPYYGRAEHLLGVVGAAGEDPTEPWRSTPYSQIPGALAPMSVKVATAARALGLHPFRLPLAINYAPTGHREVCLACNTCDGFACAVHAKNDVATTLVPAMQRAGLTLATNTVATRLVHEHGRVTGVQCVDRLTGEARHFRGRVVVVAAGALATPHLLLASGLDAVNPAGGVIGRHLMRHCNSVVLRLFFHTPAPHREFHKHLGIHDFYFGHPTVDQPRGKLGCIQQWSTPQVDFIARAVSLPRWALAWISHLSGLIVIAEDRPQRANRVEIDRHATDVFGMPRASITHHYHPRDLAARRALVRAAKQVLRRAGAGFPYQHEQRLPTFSHAVGTVRMGMDPNEAPLDEWGTFRGIERLYVADGSVFPRSGGVNPSLTIAANSLRTGDHVAGLL